MADPGSQSRWFSPPDMTIILAGVLACIWSLWLLQSTWPLQFLELLGDEPVQDYLFRTFLNTSSWTARFADPVLVALTLSWCVLRVRRPRVPWRRLARQPGTAVGFIAILACVFGSLATLRWAADIHHMQPHWADYGQVLLASSTMFGGFGVLVTWMGMALDRRWKAERSWVDRTGRILGIVWITLAVPSGILLFLFAGPFY